MKKQNQRNNSITKEDLVGILDKKFQENQKSLLKSIDKKFEANQEEMATMVNTAVQSTQDLIIGKLEQMDENIKEIHKEVQKINLNIVDVVRKEEFDELEARVTDVEGVVELKIKKA